MSKRRTFGFAWDILDVLVDICEQMCKCEVVSVELDEMSLVRDVFGRLRFGAEVRDFR